MNFAVNITTGAISECVAIFKWRDMARFFGNYLFGTGYYDVVTVLDLSTGEVISTFEHEP